MAITITKQPYKVAPSQNSMIWEFSTDNSSTLYFNVIIKNNKNKNIIAKNKIFIAPATNRSYIDISKILDNLVVTPINNSSNLLINLTGTVEYIIEVNGVDTNNIITDTKITTGVNYAYNGKLNGFDVYDNLINDYYIQQGQTSKFLTNRDSASYLHYATNEHLYFLANNESKVKNINIKYTYKDNTTFDFFIPFTNLNDELLHRINLSPKNLEQTTGVELLNILNFKIWLTDVDGNRISEEKQYNLINYSCGISTANLNWINEYGGLSSNTFQAPKEIYQNTKTTFAGNGHLNRVAGVYNSINKVLNTNVNNTYNITSQALTDSEFENLANIINSRNVYTQLTNGDLYPVIVTTSSINILKKKYTKKHNRLELNFVADSNLNLSKIETPITIINKGFDYNFNIIL